MRKLLLITLFLTNIYAWEKMFKGPGPSIGFEVHQTFDGGYIIVGTTGGDVYLIKTNSRGDSLWARTYDRGLERDDRGYSVQQTSDGGYIIAGVTRPLGGWDSKIYLIKTDSAGKVLWERIYWEGEEHIYYWGSCVQQTLNDGYTIVGTIVRGPYPTYSSDIYLIKTDSRGNPIWFKTYDKGHQDEGAWIEQTLDSGYIIAGTSIGTSDSCVWLIKTDSLGDALWTKSYSKFGDIWRKAGYCVRQTHDGGYIIAGRGEDWGGMYFPIFLIKTDHNGDTLWTKEYDGGGGDIGVSCQQTQDRGYIIVGEDSYCAPNQGIYLAKTDSLGDTLWTRTFNKESQKNASRSVEQTSDGGYIITGYVEYYHGGGGRDVYLIKTDSLGNSEGIEEKPLNEKRTFSLSVIPNPTTREAMIRFGGKNDRGASLSLYDISGRKVMELWRGKLNKNHSLKLNKKNLASGVYFLQLETHTYIEREKVIIE